MRPMGYRSYPFMMYPWINCLRPKCDSAIRFNFPECKGLPPKAPSERVKDCNMKIEPPSCASAIVLRLKYCNTCCCKHGVVTNQIDHDLIHGNLDNCATWFGAIDMLSRTVITFIRVSLVFRQHGQKCYNEKFKTDLPIAPRRKEPCAGLKNPMEARKCREQEARKKKRVKSKNRCASGKKKHPKAKSCKQSSCENLGQICTGVPGADGRTLCCQQDGKKKRWMII